MKIFYWFHFLFVFFPIELFKSSIQVALIVLFPKDSIKPGIVAIPLKLKTDWGISILANTITLTPGTLTLDVSPDKKTLYVHCIALYDPKEFIRSIQQDFEKKILRLEGSPL